MTLRAALMDRLTVFASLSDGQLATIAETGEERHLRPDQPAFFEGDPAREYFLVLSGHIKLVRGDGSGSVILALIHEGELFGVGPSHVTRRIATAVSLGETRLAVWPMDVWRRFLDEMPGLARGALHVIETRLADTQNRLVATASLDVPRRLAHAVLNLIDRAGRQEADGVRVDFPLSRRDLAALIGTTLHNVSRILTGWERDGLVEGGRRTLLVRDIEALMRRATGDAPDPTR